MFLFVFLVRILIFGGDRCAEAPERGRFYEAPGNCTPAGFINSACRNQRCLLCMLDLQPRPRFSQGKITYGSWCSPACRFFSFLFLPFFLSLDHGCYKTQCWVDICCTTTDLERRRTGNLNKKKVLKINAILTKSLLCFCS